MKCQISNRLTNFTISVTVFPRNMFETTTWLFSKNMFWNSNLLPTSQIECFPLKLLTWKIYKFEFNFLFNKKFRNCFHFFTCILPDYVGPTSSKNFEKISIFENMTAGFLLRCQNSLRWEISLICHWSIDSWKQKLSCVYDMVPKNDYI